jgi:asparagine synthase (glutamine-hydrolysing)
LSACLQRIRHRGPDDCQYYQHQDLAFGFVRLAINGQGQDGRQPLLWNSMVGLFNGEIYNYRALTQQYQLAVDGQCDSQVLLPLFAQKNLALVDELDGFFSAIVYNQATRQLYSLRDHMGKKPLYIGRSESELFITSELKALESITWFRALPLGAAQINLVTADIETLRISKPPTLFGLQQEQHTPENLHYHLRSAFTEAISKRLPIANTPVAVFLSGGLDSSLIAAIATQYRQDCVYFTLGHKASPDRERAEKLVKELGLRHWCCIDLPTSEQLPQLIAEVVYATESYNPSIISNGLATYLLAQAVSKQDIKVALSGEGADELFAGYYPYLAPEQWRFIRSQLIHDMPFTELRRLDLCSMAHGVEVRCPFLDAKVKVLADGLPFSQYFADDTNKVSLRQAFALLLPQYILQRSKTSFDVGSGLRSMVVRFLKRNGRTEREELLSIWQQFFTYDHQHPYFSHYPVFDQAIDQRKELHR